ncbi:MAG: methyltransferase regulatory domain-containing protein [Chloroflexi bacterium]|nr:methyltransferase regulatory domain-containing protein [Chloroflexota bacterium]
MTPYDRVPYGGWSYAFTHPDVLATVARLRGIPSAPVESCRVLEIGCAAGYNLIPMALSLPNARFVGIDYAARQIDEGCGLVAQLGVPNVELHHLDLAAWEGALGQFDYIVAHGIYSWVAEPVRSALLSICRAALTPNGVAYVSYNTYPGWHMMEAMRRMMLYHIREIDEPGQRAAAARELIGFLVKATGAASFRLSSYPAAYEHLLNGYFHGILNMPDRADSLFLHDELEAVNAPCYFHEFLAHAGQHGLTYVADAEFGTGLPTSLPEEVAANLSAMAQSDGDVGQYLDFVVNRTFRRSLLCRDEVALSPAIDLEVLDRLYFASHARGLLAPGTDPEAASVEFVAGDGAKLTTDHPVTIVAFTHLKSIWPRRATLAEAQEMAYVQLMETNPHLRAELYAALTGADPERQAEDRRLLAANLLAAYCTSGELVSFHLHPGSFTTEIRTRPLASGWARWEASKRTTVTDLRLRRVALTPHGRYLLPLLDGTRDADALQQVIEADGSEAAAIWRTPASLPPEGLQIELPAPSLAEQIAETLEQIANSALLWGWPIPGIDQAISGIESSFGRFPESETRPPT